MIELESTKTASEVEIGNDMDLISSKDEHYIASTMETGKAHTV